MTLNNYLKLIPLTVDVPADMLETVAGFSGEPQLDSELMDALNRFDKDDSDSLRFLMCLLGEKLEYLNEKENQ